MKQTITTSSDHGLRKGDTMRIEGVEYTITQVRETSFVVGPLPWWSRARRWISAAWSCVVAWWHR